MIGLMSTAPTFAASYVPPYIGSSIGSASFRAAVVSWPTVGTNEPGAGW